jgi:BMFP domain-containing protein YqiC
MAGPTCDRELDAFAFKCRRCGFVQHESLSAAEELALWAEHEELDELEARLAALEERRAMRGQRPALRLVSSRT